MNTNEEKGSWNEQKGKLEQKFAALTKNTMMFEDGRKKEILGKTQTRLAKTKDELGKIVQSL